MKALIGVIVLVIIFGGGYYLSQQGSQPADTQTETTNTVQETSTRPSVGTYTVIAEESSINWTAGKPLIAGYVHTGTLNVQSGTVEVADSSASGSFVIDMTSVKVTSLGGGKAGKESALEAHLKKDDFFGIETYPTATFTISSIAPTEEADTYTVTGGLTMKDKTNEVTFPVRIYMEEGKLHAYADFTIDRTLWGITFASASVFDNLANNAIGDEVTLSLKLTSILAD